MNNKIFEHFDSRDFYELCATTNGVFHSGKNGVINILTPKDKKIELVCFENEIIAFVPSAMGYPAYYPLKSASFEKPIEGVLMDLDGTSVKSEEFWMWIISLVISDLTHNKGFEFEEEDTPYISGHSVSEHLLYAIKKYCPNHTLDEARKLYFYYVENEMKEIMAGRGKKDAFKPAEGLKELLLSLKDNGVKIGLVTSGLYEKAMPEIISAFNTMKLGDPTEFYDAIITAGTTFKKGQTGTINELAVKPHPWLYSETGRFGLKIPYEKRNRIVVIEDSAAGVYSARLAGYYTVGIAGGNITESGAKSFCGQYFKSLKEFQEFIQ